MRRPEDPWARSVDVISWHGTNLHGAPNEDRRGEGERQRGYNVRGPKIVEESEKQRWYHGNLSMEREDTGHHRRRV